MSRRYFDNGNLDLIAGRHVTDKQLDSASNHAIANRIVTAEFGKVEDRLDLNNCRNVLYPIAQTVTKNGVTMTCNKDGSITLSGTNTSGSRIDFDPFPYINDYMFLKEGNYKLGGEVVGGRIQTISGQLERTVAYFDISKYRSGGGIVEQAASSDVSQWDSFTLSNAEYIGVELRVVSGANFGNGMKIYPMLVTESTEGVTGYEQGEMNNRELSVAAREMIEDIDSKQSKTLSQSIAGETTVEGALSTISSFLTAKQDALTYGTCTIELTANTNKEVNASTIVTGTVPTDARYVACTSGGWANNNYEMTFIVDGTKLIARASVTQKYTVYWMQYH